MPGRPIIELIRRDRQARRFLLAQGQSALGTGAGYVALLLIALERLDSEWAVALVLFADYLPSMALGPLAGALADRWPRRRCMVLADLVRGAAFIGLAFSSSFELMLALALVAGAGSALFVPASLSGIPDLVESERVPAAISAYSALNSLGYTLGPALAALAAAVLDLQLVLALNGVTFLVAAALVGTLRFRRHVAPRPPERAGASLLTSALEGARLLGHVPGATTLVLSASWVVLLMGMLNVAEPLLVTGALGGGAVEFGVFVAVFGAGVALGSVVSADGRSDASMVNRYVAGMAVVAVGLLALGVSPSVWTAVAAAALVGFGDGVICVHQRLLLQRSVDESVLGRVYGVVDSATAWAMGIAFLSAGAIAATSGVRQLLVVSGVLMAIGAAATLGRLRGLVATPRPVAVGVPDVAPAR